MKIRAQNCHFYILFAILLVMSSCVKEMDFDGAKDITLEPAMEIRLLEAKMTPEDMINQVEKRTGSSIQFIPGNVSPIPPLPIHIEKPISLTSEERILKYLVEGKDTIDNVPRETPRVEFEFVNTINRGFEFEISLLDKDGNPLDEAEANGAINISASVNGTEEKTIKYYTYTVNQIKKATDIAIDFTLKSGANLYKDSEGELTINATGIFNFEYDVSNGLP